LSPVQLQISKTPRVFGSEYDGTGHYCRRKDFEKLYEQPCGDITDQEMLDLAKQQAEDEAQCLQFQTEKERKDFVDSHGNVLAVIGMLV